ncbi:MAG: hypothetical protein U0S36_15005 [Candidatus Nanopelagicales bacterium]|jgi:hypothetical protein
MARSKKPDDVPRSPTGRVPQWALDEATGRTHEAVPFRGATAPSVHATPSRKARRSPWVVWVATAASVAVIAFLVAFALASR